MFNEMKLESRQLLMLDELTAGGSRHFAAGYEYVRGLLELYVADPANAASVAACGYSDLTKWLRIAAAVSRDDAGSVENHVFRSVVSRAPRAPDTPDLANEISEEVASGVFEVLLSGHFVPSLADVLRLELAVTGQLSGASAGGWGGALYFWNAQLTPLEGDTVGARISADPHQYATFLALNARAITDAAGALGRLRFDVLMAPEVQTPEAVRGALADRILSLLLLPGGAVDPARSPDLYVPTSASWSDSDSVDDASWRRWTGPRGDSGPPDAPDAGVAADGPAGDAAGGAEWAASPAGEAPCRQGRRVLAEVNGARAGGAEPMPVPGAALAQAMAVAGPYEGALRPPAPDEGLENGVAADPRRPPGQAELFAPRSW
ncbi:hypothetical protein ACFFJB_06670 [Camelimonas abortus]|uniref:Uncharacterized protein n=1 Tax=Camelimonas abortus TaxID=1017184 RepID=A0ABV7LFI5_9HYPH